MARTLLFDMFPHYEMLVEEEAGHEYADIILKPTKSSDDKMYIIEVKALSSKTTKSETNLDIILLITM